MSTFDELAGSRREWIAAVLRPWCATASLRELRKAEQEWLDIAGKVDPEATLWTWAWERFPEIVHEGLNGVDETFVVRLTLKDGTTHVGFPDARKSRRGELVLLSNTAAGPVEHGPISIDDIASVERMV